MTAETAKNIGQLLPVSHSRQAEQIHLQEQWSFVLEDYAIDHQGGAIVDISISYEYVNGVGVADASEYPDFVPIYDFIHHFLVDYPHKTDSWEMLNKRLVNALLTQPVSTAPGSEYYLGNLVESLTVKISIVPGAVSIIARSSIVTGRPQRSLRTN